MATYFIKVPGGKDGRLRFSILRREGKSAPSQQLPRLDVINRRYAEGEDFETCHRLVVELKEELRRAERPTPLLLNDNQRIVHRYLATRPRRKLVSPYAQERELIRAAEACGPLSIEHSGYKALQDHVDGAFKGKKHARVVAGINRLLLFLRKDFKLEPVAVEWTEPPYVRLSDFLSRLPEVTPRLHQVFLATLFATGARVGEGLAIRELRKHDVFILKQLSYDRDRRLDYHLSKNKLIKGHNALILPELRDYVQEWTDATEETRREFRKIKWSKICRKVFGVRAHDLRHSYAKRLAEKGLTISQIAMNLGNAEEITKRYYVGWIQGDEQVEALALKLKAK